MDIITLATTAVALATPYLIKSGEKIAEGIGESVWNWIKSAFSKNEKEVLPLLEVGEEKELISTLLEKIKTDNDFKIGLEKVVEKAQADLQSHCQQIINNKGNIEKQVNFQVNNGTIQL